MSQSIYLFLVALYFVRHIEECPGHYINIYTNNRMRITLYAIDRELIKDALQKVKSCHYMKSLYSKSHAYHIAERIFYIRRRFARMMRVYISAHEYSLNNSGWHSDFYQSKMIDLQKLGMDLDHLVEMLTELEEREPIEMVNLAGIVIPADILKFDRPSLDMASFAGKRPAGSMPTPPGMALPGMPPPGKASGPGRPRRGGATGPSGAPGLRGGPELKGGPEGRGTPKSGGAPGQAWVPNTPAGARIVRPRGGFGWF